jgi:hypothetical protein
VFVQAMPHYAARGFERAATERRYDLRMGAIETNRSYANLLGWRLAELDRTAFDDGLLQSVRAVQQRLGLKVDGVCGPKTYAALLAERQAALVEALPTSTQRLADAGMIALLEAKRTWLRNIIDLPAKGTPEYEASRTAIDKMIRSTDGLHWDWEPLYAGEFEWCGAFAAYAWRAAGVPIATRRTFFSSTYRLDRWARYWAFEGHANPKPAQGPQRQFLELDSESGPVDAFFPDDVPPRAGDILLVGGLNTAYGKHITIVESYDVATGVFITIEGNGSGLAPNGGPRHGVIRGRRPVGLAHGASKTTYHARRLIRPSLADLA